MSYSYRLATLLIRNEDMKQVTSRFDTMNPCKQIAMDNESECVTELSSSMAILIRTKWDPAELKGEG